MESPRSAASTFSRELSSRVPLHTRKEEAEGQDWMQKYFIDSKEEKEVDPRGHRSSHWSAVGVSICLS